MTPPFLLICAIIVVQLGLTVATFVACMSDLAGIGQEVCTDGRIVNSLAAALAVALAIYKADK